MASSQIQSVIADAVSAATGSVTDSVEDTAAGGGYSLQWMESQVDDCMDMDTAAVCDTQHDDGQDEDDHEHEEDDKEEEGDEGQSDEIDE